MEKQQKKRIKKYVSWVLILCIVALLAALPMIAANEEVAEGPQASILSASAELRDISVAVFGGGTLVAEDAVSITIPAAVKVTEYLVGNGDIVEEGQQIARIDRVSVMTAITQVQETLEYIQEELNDNSSKTASDKVTATAGGTVKVIYGEKGENVQDVILRDGALAVLSLDGMMAVQIQRSTNLSGGDAVCVTLSDGTEVEGRVESNLEGTLTVTIDDDGYDPGEEVKVTTEDGDRIGSGALYIHSPWNVVAYSGTISQVNIKVGDTVKSGKVLFNLEDTGYTAQFDALSRQHREYEELMLELFRMYQSEAVTAPRDGMITGVDETGAYMLSGSDTGWTLSLLANSPNGDDETAYVNYIGQVAEVGIDGLIMNMNPQNQVITDYKDLSSVSLDTALMTEQAVYAGTAPVYELSGEEWIQISAEAITAGDILLFAGDSAGNFVWVVRVAAGTAEPGTPDPGAPSDPADPTGPSGPADPVDPTEPGGSDTTTDPTTPGGSGAPGGQGNPGGSMPQGGGYPSMGGGMAQEDAFEVYSLETVIIASVTAQEKVSVQITVDELDISRIYVGQETSVTLDALPGEKFSGTVTAISASGENEGGNSKFTVDVTVSKTEDMLPGMRANVSVVLSTSQQVTAIPAAALIETGTRTLVYTGYDEETETFTGEIEVSTGISDGEYVQILSDLDRGQTIYYPYYDTLVISNAPEGPGGFLFG